MLLGKVTLFLSIIACAPTITNVVTEMIKIIASKVVIVMMFVSFFYLFLLLCPDLSCQAYTDIKLCKNVCKGQYGDRYMEISNILELYQ